ncbi:MULTISPECIES: Slp family lipoprotein [unclassified Erwinia]|uniref:Slp family lipoprotein n=1 Tax=unclassified Erwinia TaxID=2622719 RepID=UPI00082EE583|nr:Slp family lipoprotein [Erwinia sp. ErVv1]
MKKSHFAARHTFKGVVLSSVILFLSGCASVPQSIRGEPGAISPASFEKISQAPSLYQGREVRLGGKVINVINLPEKTIMEIAILPLNRSAKPVLGDSYQGRILAYSKNFIDPVNVLHRYITVLGQIEGTEPLKIGQTPYRFLRLNVAGYQVWQQEENFIPFDGMSYAWSPEWGYPLPGDGLNGVYPVADGSYLVR